MKHKLRMLAACEYSGRVRDAFAAKGWEAWSCDMLPSDKPGNHFQGDALKFIKRKKFDLLIGFPPCTYLTYAGMANWHDYGRAEKRIEAARFFMALYNSGVKYVCVENPQGIMAKIFREPDQTIHPYYFGEKEMKRTCLWLKNLPRLQYRLQNDLFSTSTATEKPKPYNSAIIKSTGKIKNRYFSDTWTGGIKTGHERSLTFLSIANAMAEQWTAYFFNLK